MKNFLTKKTQLDWGVPPKSARLLWKTPTTRKARMTPFRLASIHRCITQLYNHSYKGTLRDYAGTSVQHSEHIVGTKKAPTRASNCIKYRFQFVRRVQRQTFAYKYIIANLKDASSGYIHQHPLHSTALNLY